MPPGIEFLVAEVGGKLVGLASIGTLYPAKNSDSQLYLKELFVTETQRSRGIGKALLASTAALAIEHGYDRIDWTTEVDNLKAQALYEKIGAQRKATTVPYRLEGVALLKLAKT